MSRDTLQVINRVLSASVDDFNLLRKEAADVTLHSFGNKRLLFNPVYISDVCVNDCAYCGFRNSNRDFSRTTLTTNQVLSEVEFVLSRGVRKILLLAGEYGRNAYTKMIFRAIRAIKDTYPDIWIGLESAPLEEEDYHLYNKVGLDSVILFQETYSKQTYKKHHGKVGPKSNYDYRRNGLAKAVNAGIEEVGFGVLFGLTDPVKEMYKMHRHANEIKALNPKVKIRFSFPRMQFASGQTESNHLQVTEKTLTRLIVATRLAFPESRIVLTARETQGFRLGLLDIVTDIGEGGSTMVGGYTVNNKGSQYSQFSLPGIGKLNVFKDHIAGRGYELA